MTLAKAGYTGKLSSTDFPSGYKTVYMWLLSLEGCIGSYIYTSHDHQWKVERNKKDYSRKCGKFVHYPFIKEFPTLTRDTDNDVD